MLEFVIQYLIYVYACLPFFILLGYLWAIIVMRNYDDLVRAEMDKREETIEVQFGKSTMIMTREQKEQWDLLPRDVKRKFLTKEFRV